MKKLIIFGAGDLARLVSFYIEELNETKIIAYSVDDKYYTSETYLGKPLIPYSRIKRYAGTLNTPPLLVTIGYADMKARETIFKRIKNDGFTTTNFIGSKLAKTCKLGTNNIILPNVQIEPFTEIGDNNIFWNGSHVCHDASINSHNFFAANSLIGGNVIIKNGCFIAFNSTVIQNVTVEDDTLLGAGAVLTESNKKNRKYLGCPAKEVGKNTRGIKL
ncbi:acetyltransferase [Agarivorans gilvus]|uniref:PglD N-terminal domain-containing protein n=1 Tax=Agarivorans gilvus TaxID=680279 RepID=A0ABQ1I2L1_9ALTE|nr:acetyltransferase [Agarivorans gilvus]GGB10527.1 hypothetical protein GCM10007414_24870 [Agarivorans gilvus]